tara:strand:- start:456 stop:680 length:225 start_codon:yes stop_codon:yes gene_type:complete
LARHSLSRLSYKPFPAGDSGNALLEWRWALRSDFPMMVGREGEVERSKESLDAWGVTEEQGFEHEMKGPRDANE